MFNIHDKYVFDIDVNTCMPDLGYRTSLVAVRGRQTPAEKCCDLTMRNSRSSYVQRRDMIKSMSKSIKNTVKRNLVQSASKANTVC
jgi:hypothetical protein